MEQSFQLAATPDVGHLIAGPGARFFLSSVCLSTATVEGGLLDMLIFLTINRANRVAVLAAGRPLRGILADRDRTPISVSAVAAWMDTPFETVRRHVRKLCDRGLCGCDAGGVWIRHDALAVPRFDAALKRSWTLAERLVCDARRLDLDLPVCGGARDVAERRVVAARLGADFVLDTFEMIAAVIGLRPMETLVFQAMAAANTQALAPHRGRDRACGDPPGGRARAPVTVYSLASVLQLPYETTRRHVWKLVEMNLAERARGGVIIGSRILRRPEVREVTVAQAGLARGLAQSLVAAGVGHALD